MQITQKHWFGLAITLALIVAWMARYAVSFNSVNASPIIVIHDRWTSKVGMCTGQEACGWYDISTIGKK